MKNRIEAGWPGERDNIIENELKKLNLASSRHYLHTAINFRIENQLKIPYEINEISKNIFTAISRIHVDIEINDRTEIKETRKAEELLSTLDAILKEFQPRIK